MRERKGEREKEKERERERILGAIERENENGRKSSSFLRRGNVFAVQPTLERRSCP